MEKPSSKVDKGTFYFVDLLRLSFSTVLALKNADSGRRIHQPIFPAVFRFRNLPHPFFPQNL